MSAYILPGRSKIFWVPGTGGIADPANPTAAEINAGTDMTGKVSEPPDIPRNTQVADSSDLSSSNDKGIRGTTDISTLSFMVKRDTGTETEYEAISEGDEGFLAVFRQGIAGASPAAGDVADVYTCQALNRRRTRPGRNEIDRAEFQLVQSDDPNEDVALS